MIKAAILALGLAAVVAAIVGLTLAPSPHGAPAQAQEPASPPAPANVRAVNGAAPGRVFVLWDTVADAAYYRIGWVNMETFRAVQAESEREWLDVLAFHDVVNQGQNDQTLSDLEPGVEYAFIAASIGHRFGNAGSWSDWTYLTTTAAEATSCPTNTGTTPDAPGGSATPTPTPEPAATATPTPTVGPVGNVLDPTPTARPAPTATPTPAAGPTGNVLDPTPTARPRATATPAPTPTATPTPTARPTPTATPAPTPTPTTARNTGSAAGDRAALVAFYNATNGPNWRYKGRWLTDAPIGRWYGVTTDSSGRVTHLEVIENVQGTIPAELGNLSSLRELSLTYNRLEGAIPAELGNLSNLKYLDLTSNRLEGKIPAELGNLSNLRLMDLSANRLEGAIPTELGNLSNLYYLDLARNRLEGKIPSELGNLSNLGSLRLGGNQLTGCIPAGLSGVKSNDLSTLGLSSCN